MSANPEPSRQQLITQTYDHMVIVGPTASGKTALAMALARRLGGEIVCADSIQMFRKFYIGAAQPTEADRQAVDHHLFDILDADQAMDAATYGKMARKKVAEISQRGRLPLVVGGSGLYLRAFWQQNWHSYPSDANLRLQLQALTNDELRARLAAIDPARAGDVHPNDRFRLLRSLEIVTLLNGPMNSQTADKSNLQRSLVIRLMPPRQWLCQRIVERSRQMLQQGLINEVKVLLAGGNQIDKGPMTSIGYRQVCDYLMSNGGMTVDTLQQNIVIATRQYAKKQATWFRKVDSQLLFSECDTHSNVTAVENFVDSFLVSC